MRTDAQAQQKKLSDAINEVGTRIEITEAKARATRAEEAAAYYNLVPQLRSQREQLEKELDALCGAGHGGRAP